MTNQQGATSELAPTQTAIPDAMSLQRLQQHRAEVMLRRGDVRVQLQQLEERKAAAGPRDRTQFDGQIAVLRHQEMAATLDLEATGDKIAQLDRANRSQSTVVVQPARDPLIGRKQVEELGYGTFLLLIPIVFALARRIWLRSSADARLGADLESSPRLRRMEEGIEAIAVEVERIGEAQRFATKLLVERPADPAANRATPTGSPSARRAPGTITPH